MFRSISWREELFFLTLNWYVGRKSNAMKCIAEPSNWQVVVKENAMAYVFIYHSFNLHLFPPVLNQNFFFVQYRNILSLSERVCRVITVWKINGGEKEGKRKVADFLKIKFFWVSFRFVQRQEEEIAPMIDKSNLLHADIRKWDGEGKYEEWDESYGPPLGELMGYWPWILYLKDRKIGWHSC